MKLKVTQIRSIINRKEDQKRTIAALGLGKISRSRIHDDNPVIRGMINKVIHLISVEEIKEKAASSKSVAAKKTTEKVTEKKIMEPVDEKTVKAEKINLKPEPEVEAGKTKSTAKTKAAPQKTAAKPEKKVASPKSKISKEKKTTTTAKTAAGKAAPKSSTTTRRPKKAETDK
ncbi:MAG: 50S ribosomal protein L30 [Candidatus Cloacimonetes bacterium]|nr:50S ribosomal protein L30 [Candidatus Cloacimonadota bacterium]